jgi:GWxTD domain-containing protein
MKMGALLVSSVAALLVIIPAAPWVSAQGQSRDAVRQEEALDYFEKWLREDVVYIISPEERAVFQSLTTEEEKEQFIEQFWFRRDPDPRAAHNEFKEEHYRRIAYANERFFSAIPGWRTDRGRIYIIHGPPAEIDSRPSGGTYHRPIHEGGGTTATFPFEVWRYRHIEGLGSDIEIEFVDPTMTGEFRLARHADEKDALLFVPGAGLTLAEEMGLAEKKDRPFFSPGYRDEYPLMYRRHQDNPFQRYETITFIQRPPELKYNDLKELVEVNISFDNPLPFETRHDYFRLNDDQVLVPVTLELENRNLTFQDEGGRHRARVAIYGIVTSITNRLVTEFEDDVAVDFTADSLERGLRGRSLYQKILPVERRLRYRLDLVVKDLNSGRVGILRKAIIPPVFGGEELTASALMLSDFIRMLDEIPKDNEMFVLGDVWIRPSLSRTFPAAGRLGVYLQLYNAGIDQTTFEPELEVRYAVKRGAETVFEQTDDTGAFVQYFSGQRIVLINAVPLEDLTPGEYRMEVVVRDRIREAEVVVDDSFRIVATPQIASN